MKKINICYFCIIFILNLTTYINRVFEKALDINILKSIKMFNIFLLLFFTIILFILKNNFKKSDIKIIFLIIIFTIFLQKYYLSFFIIIITSFIEKRIRLKYFFFTSCFFYIFILFLNSLGILEFNNILYGIRKYEKYEVYRHALGFAHPNMAMSNLIPIFSLLYYIYYPKYKKIVIGIILVVGKIIFDLTFSRTTFLLIILFIILILIKDKYIKKLRLLFLTEGFFIVFFTFYLPFYFRDTVLNKLFSGRLWLFHYYLTNHKITLFGYSKIKEFYERYPLDNVYLKTLFENGLLGFSLLIILIFLTMYILFKNKDYKAVRIFSIILIFGFMEGTALFYYFNIIYFIICDYIFKKGKNNA